MADDPSVLSYSAESMTADAELGRLVREWFTPGNDIVVRTVGWPNRYSYNVEQLRQNLTQ